MEQNQQECLRDEVASSDEMLAAKEEIEFLRELVESQNLHIRHLESQLQEVKQELEIINDEFSNALLSGVCFEEAKALAKVILSSEKSATESLAEFLSDIYNSTVMPEELKQVNKLSIPTKPLKNDVSNKIIAHSQQVRTNSKHLHQSYNELGCHFVALKANLTKLRELRSNFQETDRSQERGVNLLPERGVSPAPVTEFFLPLLPTPVILYCLSALAANFQK